MGGGGRAKSKKNIRARENKIKKIIALQLTLKKFMLPPKNIHTRNFTKRQKIPAARKFDNHSPVTFLMVHPEV